MRFCSFAAQSYYRQNRYAEQVTRTKSGRATNSVLEWQEAQCKWIKSSQLQVCVNEIFNLSFQYQLLVRYPLLWWLKIPATREKILWYLGYKNDNSFG